MNEIIIANLKKGNFPVGRNKISYWKKTYFTVNHEVSKNNLEEFFIPCFGLLITDNFIGRLKNENFWKHITVFSKVEEFDIEISDKLYVYLNQLNAFIQVNGDQNCFIDD